MSELNGFLDDPRLTAYALGELTGDDLREIEALLASNADARRVVDEIRATASLVTAELGSAGGEALTPEQRARITARAGAATPVVPMRRVYWTAAAALIVGATAGAATSTMWMAPRTLEKSVASSPPAPKVAQDVRARPENRLEPLTRVPLNGAPSGFSASKSSEELGDLSKRVGGVGNDVNIANANKPAPGGTDVDKEKDGSTLLRSSKGVVLPVEPPKPAQPKAGDKVEVPAPYRGPGGESSPTGRPRSATDAPPPPEGGGPSTPGDTPSGPTTGGPDGGGGGGGGGGPATGGGGSSTGGVFGPGKGEGAKKKDALADFHKLTEEKKRLQDDLFGTEVQFPAQTAAYSHIEDNPFRLVKDNPLSTFGADVDTASYSNVRRFLNSGRLPPPGAVRIEEMVNYFPYDYAPPTDGRPFAVRVDVAGCPWKTDHRLVRIGIKGKVVESAARPAANLVFLLDVSGSMQPAERLPLVLSSMKLLVEKLEAKDRVAIVVYAGASGLALPSTSCEDKGKILAALDSLHAGGSTNGAAGIQLAYDVASQNKIDGGVNRVILATDGDFNVGVSDDSSLVKLIEEKRKTGVFLSVLGVGTDNLKDAKMEQLADKGNGAYAYVDTLKEGQKVLVEQAAGTLYTIAKDVKFQVEFNPAQVGSWRLIGYENRVLAAEDFKNDAKDAGEIGAGHTVTALYELVPTGVLTETAGVEPLKYQQPPAPTGASSNELLTVKLRWKAPDSDVSTPMEVAVIDEGLSYSAASPDFKFAASVAAFGMCLRDSPHKGQANLDVVAELASEGAANDPGGYRKEFVGLVQRAKLLGAK